MVKKAAQQRNRPEVLAPAGSMEALTAAVRCGADAVYLGAGDFNARRNAQNFSTAALKEAVETCHICGIKVYLTLNTLVRQDEMEAALDLAAQACACGVDAFILQDMGLARLLRQAAPEAHLHASTQLSCHTPAGVRELMECGFRRVVLAREMSREEIAACAGLGCELEVFVHGALCMSVSGQCYLSAMLGGRSGNRGLCAQPCRLPFAPGECRTAGEQTALSLKDLCLLDHVKELAEIGVASLKIEGRMKRPEYVAAATSAYRAAAEGIELPQQTVQDLRAVFSRSGFTDGYYNNTCGKDMFGARSHEDVTAAAPVLGRLQRLYDKEKPLIGLALEFILQKGEAAVLIIDDGQGHRVRVTGDIPETAVSRPLDEERAAVQLKKMGGTPFWVDTLTCRMEEGLALSASSLNALRRRGIEQLVILRGTVKPVCFKKNDVHAADNSNNGYKSEFTYKIVARFAAAGQVPADLNGILPVLPLETTEEQWRTCFSRLPARQAAVEIPRGLFGHERDKKTVALLKKAKNAGAGYGLCGNIGAIPLALEAGLCPMGGFGLNITNGAAMEQYAHMGLQAALLSQELTFSQMRFAWDERAVKMPMGLMVYGRQPLMLMRNCPRGGKNGCSGCGGGSVVDRKGYRFPIACGSCAELLNSTCLYWADKLEELPQKAFFYLHFTDETCEQAAAVCEAYRTGGMPMEGITRGLYRRGVE